MTLGLACGKPVKALLFAVSMLGSVAACAADSGANDGESCEAASPFASAVKSFEFGSGSDFGQATFPEPVLGPPSGGGCCAGSLDVTSLGDGGFVTLEFDNNSIVDGSGADFIVFENAFRPAGAPEEDVFAELGEVSVSQDGAAWFTYPCTATRYPYEGCAGWHPVLLDAQAGPIEPLSVDSAGGDPFDLAEFGLDWARYVMVRDRPALDGGPGTFDLDSVGIVHPRCTLP
jgi:hypothetical protein